VKLNAGLRDVLNLMVIMFSVIQTPSVEIIINYMEGRKESPLPALPHFEEQKWGRKGFAHNLKNKRSGGRDLHPLWKAKNGGGNGFSFLITLFHLLWLNGLHEDSQSD
jgi:hypothetical protein